MRLFLSRSSKNFSGAEVYNVNLLRELGKQSSFDIVFLTNLDRLAKELRKSDVKVHLAHWLPEEVGTKRQLLKVFFYAAIFIPRYLATIRKLENGKRFDVVCFQSRTEMIFLTPVLKLMRYKVVWIQHGPLFISQAAGIVKKLFFIESRIADKIIAVSKDTKQDLVRGGVYEKRVNVIYIGTEAKSIAPISRRSNTFVIAFMGTLTKEKGIEGFIQVSVSLSHVNTTKYSFLIIGGGPDLHWMKREVKSLGMMSQYRFTGLVSDVKTFLNTADLLLLPTHHYEGVSMAILEAQAMGIPVLSIDIGGNREIIKHGYNGFLYKQGDFNSMARNIRLLAKNRAKLLAIGKHARQTVAEKFNIRKQAKKFSLFFERL